MIPGEVHLLVKEQESAVKAVKLERLVGNIGEKRRRRRGGRRVSGTEEEEDTMSEAQTRRVITLTEPTRPWLHPHYRTT